VAAGKGGRGAGGRIGSNASLMPEIKWVGAGSDDEPPPTGKKNQK